MEGGCYGCGDDNPISLEMTFSAEDPGMVATFTPRPEHRGAPGFLHGGVASTALDEAMAALCWVLDDIHVVTATLELRFKKAIPIDGSALRVEAWRDHPESRRRQRVHGRILLADGSIAATASGLFVQMPEGPQAWRP